MVSAAEHIVVLRPGEQFQARSVTSPNGTYTLEHQYDGDVVVRSVADGEEIWAADSVFQGEPDPGEPLLDEDYGWFGLQEDGVLAVRNCNGTDLWYTHRRGQMLVLDDEGHIALLDDSGARVWESGSVSAGPDRTLDLSGYRMFSGLVVRTDFSDPEAWARILSEIAENDENSAAFVIDDPVWANASWLTVVSALPKEWDDEEMAPRAVFIANAEAMHDPDGCLLGVNLDDVPDGLDPDVFRHSDYDFSGRVHVRSAVAGYPGYAMGLSGWEEMLWDDLGAEPWE
ncbi:DUF6924 domain-containing protein [Kineosporia babensis]|uniref:DUF6924 domain-containing protein n=1 Tax=Kineosporia babensis TaxID=499548 RepID=A0A9X1NFE1_9ACTN|nr:hypothetical protein [Kineosporia babensis]MCD5313987.1 hypothetical protein [Kineosporia babensis]